MATTALSTDDAAVFDALNRHLGGQLDLIAFYDTGSTARVFHVKAPVSPDLDLRVDRIIKVFRHEDDLIALDLEKVFRQELTALIGISHSNLIAIYSAGAFDLTPECKVRYYVMEYLPGALDLDKWLTSENEQLGPGDFIRLLLQICSGLEALHRAKILHCDLKFGNVLVGTGNVLKIADLGFSKLLKKESAETAVLTTRKYLPDRYARLITETEHDPRRMQVNIPRQELDETFDLHYFGRLLLDAMEIPGVRASLDEMEAKGLELVAERTNLDSDDLRLPRYKSVVAIAQDLAKLLPVYLNRSGVAELTAYTGTRTIRIPISGSIPFPKRVERIISHPLFLRLHNANQLGLTQFVFPGATHTRFEHSLGVFSNVGRYIAALLSDDHQPYFRQLVDETKINTVLLAGLVHDVGQNAFAHTLEDLELVPPHEEVSRAFITGEGLDQLVPDELAKSGGLSEGALAEWGEIDMDRLLWMISKTPHAIAADYGWDMLKSIINGPLDADKTDYLVRDAHHAGVEYARSIDITRLMNSLTAVVVRTGRTRRGVMAITWKGVQSAENVILARSQMFWVLYWHHAVRAAHGMVGEAAFEHLQGGDETVRRRFTHTLYSRTVGELLELLESSSSRRAAALASMVRQRRLYKRGIGLDYRDDEDLYRALTRRRDEDAREGDLLLHELSREVADEANRELANHRSATRLTSSEVMIDVPKGDKDRLDPIYLVGKDSIVKEYTSKALSGTAEDWQNRVRTIRVFVAPDVPTADRQILRRRGREILSAVCSA